MDTAVNSRRTRCLYRFVGACLRPALAFVCLPAKHFSVHGFSCELAFTVEAWRVRCGDTVCVRNGSC